MNRLALCVMMTIGFAQQAGAKDIVCSWQYVAGWYRNVDCHVAGAHGVATGGMRIEDLTPTPEIVELVARIVRGSAVDPGLVLAVIAAESAFDRQAVSPKNAMGLMQLMPETVARFGVRHPFDAEENIRAGVSYLRLLLQKYRDLKLALAAYNAGEGPVLSYGSVPPYEETTEYVARVLRLYERYKTMSFGRGETATAVAATAQPLRPATSLTAAAVPARATAPSPRPTAVSTRAKEIGCGLICRGNMLAARLDDAAARRPPSTAAVARARTN